MRSSLPRRPVSKIFKFQTNPDAGFDSDEVGKNEYLRDIGRIILKSARRTQILHLECYQ